MINYQRACKFYNQPFRVDGGQLPKFNLRTQKFENLILDFILLKIFIIEL